MRLIDADALFPVTLTDGGYWCKEVYYKSDIDNAPTIDAAPVVHGYWIGYETSAYGGTSDDGDVRWIPKKFFRCSECRKGSAVQSAFCPSCGARMDAEEAQQ